MNSLRDIRRRLRSAENIKKITDAMERVAAARLRRAQSCAESARPYAAKMQALVEKLAKSCDDSHPLFEEVTGHRKALIIVSADKGLSGSYNSTILAAAENFLQQQPAGSIDLFLFGKKAIDYYQNKAWPIAFCCSDWAGKMSLADIQSFLAPLIEGFAAHRYAKVWLLYTHALSIAQRKLVLSQFLPIEKPCAAKLPTNYIFEPTAEVIFAQLLPHYCAIRIQQALFEAYVAELGARIMAMQMASKILRK